uniref:Uncharacterized protein n=1 Tax=Ananas comosus var. bracteatus TaxID=296719 RepID=A0A6V7PMR1_ANACO|nr:unnamed protein product [Ananas comosus var. bracteatus]
MPPKVWFALKKSLPCKSEALDVHDPKPRNQLSTMLKRRRRRPCVPWPIAHEVVLKDSMCELKITHGCAAAAAAAAASAINGGGDVGATFVGSLRPGTPGLLT